MVGCAVGIKGVCLFMFTKIINFLTNTITTNIAVIIPIAATAVGFMLKTYYKRGGVISMVRLFRHNKKKIAMEIELDEMKLKEEKKKFVEESEKKLAEIRAKRKQAEIESIKAEHERKELMLKELNYLIQVIDTLEQEIKTATDKEFADKCKQKIEELNKRKKELLMEL